MINKTLIMVFIVICNAGLAVLGFDASSITAVAMLCFVCFDVKIIRLIWSMEELKVLPPLRL